MPIPPDPDDRERALRRQAKADLARINVLNDIVNRYATLGEDVTELIRLSRAVLQQAPLQDAIGEPLTEMAERIEVIERQITRLVDTLRMLVFQQAQPTQTLASLDRIERQTEVPALRKRLQTQRANLNELEQKKAEYGLDAPLSLINQIKATEEEVERLETVLNELD